MSFHCRQSGIEPSGERRLVHWNPSSFAPKGGELPPDRQREAVEGFEKRLEEAARKRVGISDSVVSKAFDVAGVGGTVAGKGVESAAWAPKAREGGRYAIERHNLRHAIGMSRSMREKALYIESNAGGYLVFYSSAGRLRVRTRGLTDKPEEERDEIKKTLNSAIEDVTDLRTKGGWNAEEWDDVLKALTAAKNMSIRAGKEALECAVSPGAALDLRQDIKDESPMVHRELLIEGARKQESDIDGALLREGAARKDAEPRILRAEKISAVSADVATLFPSGSPDATALSAIGQAGFNALRDKATAIETEIRFTITDIAGATEPALVNEFAQMTAIAVELNACEQHYDDVVRTSGPAFFKEVDRLAQLRAQLPVLEQNYENMKTGLFSRNQAGVGAAALAVNRCKEDISRAEIMVQQQGRDILPAASAMLQSMERAKSFVGASAEAARQRARDARIILRELKDQVGKPGGVTQEQYLDVLASAAGSNLGVLDRYMTPDARSADPARFRAFAVNLAKQNGDVLAKVSGDPEWKQGGAYVPEFTELVSAAVAQNPTAYDSIPPIWKTQNRAELGKIFAASVVGKPGAAERLAKDLALIAPTYAYEGKTGELAAWWHVFALDQGAFRSAVNAPDGYNLKYFKKPAFAALLDHFAVTEVRANHGAYEKLKTVEAVQQWLLVEGPLNLMERGGRQFVDFVENHRDLFFKRLETDGSAFKFAPEAWKKSVQDVVLAARVNANVVEFADPRVQKNPLVVAAARLAEQGNLTADPPVPRRGNLNIPGVPALDQAMRQIKVGHLTPRVFNFGTREAERESFKKFMAEVVANGELQPDVAATILANYPDLLLKANKENYQNLDFLKKQAATNPELLTYADQVLTVEVEGKQVSLAQAVSEGKVAAGDAANKEYVKYAAAVLASRPGPRGKALIIDTASGTPTEVAKRLVANPELADPAYKDLLIRILKEAPSLATELHASVIANEPLMDQLIAGAPEIVLFIDAKMDAKRYLDVLWNIMDTAALPTNKIQGKLDIYLLKEDVNIDTVVKIITHADVKGNQPLLLRVVPVHPAVTPKLHADVKENNYLALIKAAAESTRPGGGVALLADPGLQPRMRDALKLPGVDSDLARFLILKTDGKELPYTVAKRKEAAFVRALVTENPAIIQFVNEDETGAETEDIKDAAYVDILAAAVSKDPTLFVHKHSKLADWIGNAAVERDDAKVLVLQDVALIPKLHEVLRKDVAFMRTVVQENGAAVKQINRVPDPAAPPPAPGAAPAFLDDITGDSYVELVQAAIGDGDPHNLLNDPDVVESTKFKTWIGDAAVPIERATFFVVKKPDLLASVHATKRKSVDFVQGCVGQNPDVVLKVDTADISGNGYLTLVRDAAQKKPTLIADGGLQAKIVGVAGGLDDAGRALVKEILAVQAPADAFCTNLVNADKKLIHAIPDGVSAQLYVNLLKISVDAEAANFTDAEKARLLAKVPAMAPGSPELVKTGAVLESLRTAGVDHWEKFLEANPKLLQHLPAAHLKYVDLALKAIEKEKTVFSLVDSAKIDDAFIREAIKKALGPDYALAVLDNVIGRGIAGQPTPVIIKECVQAYFTTAAVLTPVLETKHPTWLEHVTQAALKSDKAVLEAALKGGKNAVDGASTVAVWNIIITGNLLPKPAGLAAPVAGVALPQHPAPAPGAPALTAQQLAWNDLATRFAP
ncbi:hypothetical protein COU80_00760 [Candidatus Peregrinibacteria bacterium CG10_big_fil_rev_8_21_14_0_10_55_24]|nr:MAG: hypothetical protein COU80_00760 [Candidatus Peregrinibacteria bacterium CG10_big_fil_rev_8_21_14_0_10_55_24]